MRFDMFESGASDTPPSPPDNPSYGYPSNGNPVTGDQPTVPGAYFFYALTAELQSLMEYMGIEPKADKNDQLVDVFRNYLSQVEQATSGVTEMQGATSDADGKSGIVPMPSAGDQDKFLTGSGAWVSAPSGMILGQTILSSVPLNDVSVHLLDGSLLPNGGIYQAFNDYISGLQSDYPYLFCSQDQFDISVNSYGSCGKFVVSENGVRLPKIVDILQGTTDLSAVGDLVAAGLPNVKGTITFVGDDQSKGTNSLVSEVVNVHSAYGNGGSTGTRFYATQKTVDASLSSPYYRDDVQKPTPQTVKALIYICVATAVKTPVEVDIDEIATDLNGKADKDLGNVTAPVFMYPDYQAGVEISVTDMVEHTFTVPADGFVTFETCGYSTGRAGYLYIDDVLIVLKDSTSNTYLPDVYAFCPVQSGSVIRYKSGYQGTLYTRNKLMFFPAKGAN